MVVRFAIDEDGDKEADEADDEAGDLPGWHPPPGRAGLGSLSAASRLSRLPWPDEVEGPLKRRPPPRAIPKLDHDLRNAVSVGGKQRDKLGGLLWFVGLADEADLRVAKCCYDSRAVCCSSVQMPERLETRSDALIPGWRNVSGNSPDEEVLVEDMHVRVSDEPIKLAAGPRSVRFADSCQYVDANVEGPRLPVRSGDVPSQASSRIKPATQSRVNMVQQFDDACVAPKLERESVEQCPRAEPALAETLLQSVSALTRTLGGAGLDSLQSTVLAAVAGNHGEAAVDPSALSIFPQRQLEAAWSWMTIGNDDEPCDEPALATARSQTSNTSAGSQASRSCLSREDTMTSLPGDEDDEAVAPYPVAKASQQGHAKYLGGATAKGRRAVLNPLTSHLVGCHFDDTLFRSGGGGRSPRQLSGDEDFVSDEEADLVEQPVPLSPTARGAVPVPSAWLPVMQPR